MIGLLAWLRACIFSRGTLLMALVFSSAHTPMRTSIFSCSCASIGFWKAICSAVAWAMNSSLMRGEVTRSSGCPPALRTAISSSSPSGNAGVGMPRRTMSPG